VLRGDERHVPVGDDVHYRSQRDLVAEHGAGVGFFDRTLRPRRSRFPARYRAATPASSRSCAHCGPKTQFGWWSSIISSPPW
jgi:hypothetical protein